MTEIRGAPRFRMVDAAAMSAAERRYPKGHFVAFHEFTEECGNSADFEALMDDLYARGYTPEDSVIVRIGDDDGMLTLLSKPE